MAADDPIPLNCPKCRRALRYMRATDEGFPLYVCVEHGWFLIGHDKRLHETPTPPDRQH